MADAVLQLEVILENGQYKVESKEVKDDIRKTGDAAEKAGEKGKKGFGKMTEGMKTFAKAAKATVVLALVAGFVKLVNVGLKSAAAMEQNRIAFATMLKSGEKADKLLKSITDFAAKTPFQLPGLIEASKRLLAFGVAQENIIPTLQNLGNAAGGNAEKLDRLTLAYGKLKAKGKASLEEINMFTEAGVPLMDALAERFNVTTGEMFKMISTGKVGFKDVKSAIEDLTTGAGKFAGMLEKQSQSLGGMFSTLKDQIGLIVLDFGQKLSPAFKNLIKSFMLGTSSGSVFADILGVIASVAAKLVNTFALVVQGTMMIAISAQRAWTAMKKLKFIMDTGIDPEKLEAQGGALNLANQKIWDGIIQREKDLRAQSAKTSNMMSDTVSSILGLQEDINESKKETIELEKKAQKIAKESVQGPKSGKGAKDQKDPFGERMKRLKEYHNLELSEEEQQQLKISEQRREQQTKAAQEYEAYLNHKLSLDSVYWQGVSTVAKTASIYMAQENKKLFRFGQLLAISQAWINTFLGMTKAYAQLGPIGGPVGAAVVFGAGVLQTKKIAQQKPPEFAAGAFNIPDTSPAIVHQGEMIIPKTFADSVRAGEAVVGAGGAEGGNVPEINVQIDGETLFRINERFRDDAAQNMGSSGSFPVESAY